MKRGRRRANTNTQEVANVTDQDAGYLEISARPRDVEQFLHQISRKINSTQMSSDVALEGHANAIIQGFTEFFTKKVKQKGRAAGYHVVNLPQTMKIPAHVAIKGYLAWEDDREPGTLDAGSHGQCCWNLLIHGIGKGYLHQPAESERPPEG